MNESQDSLSSVKKTKVYVVSFEWAHDGDHGSFAIPFVDKQKAIDEYNRQLNDIKNGDAWESDALKDPGCFEEPIYEDNEDACTYAWSERKLGDSWKERDRVDLANYSIYQYGWESEEHSYLKLEEFECEGGEV